MHRGGLEATLRVSGSQSNWACSGSKYRAIDRAGGRRFCFAVPLIILQRIVRGVQTRRDRNATSGDAHLAEAIVSHRGLHSIDQRQRRPWQIHGVCTWESVVLRNEGRWMLMGDLQAGSSSLGARRRNKCDAPSRSRNRKNSAPWCCRVFPIAFRDLQHGEGRIFGARRQIFGCVPRPLHNLNPLTGR